MYIGVIRRERLGYLESSVTDVQVALIVFTLRATQYCGQ